MSATKTKEPTVTLNLTEKHLDELIFRLLITNKTDLDYDTHDLRMEIVKMAGKGRKKLSNSNPCIVKS
jgi:hypothetical protein